VIGWRLDDVVQKIRGPGGTQVRLQLLPAGAAPGSAQKVVEFTRNRVSLEAQASHKAMRVVQRNGHDVKVGVITVPSFYQDYDASRSGAKDYRSTTRDVQRLISELRKDGADVLIMAAAPADFRPAQVSSQKIKKAPGEDTMPLTLTKNPDILAGLCGLPGAERLLKVGFAAETEHLLDNARAKMVAKDQHLQILNEAVSSLGSETSAVTILDRAGGVEALPMQSKVDTAGHILDRIAALLEQQPTGALS